MIKKEREGKIDLKESKLVLLTILSEYQNINLS